jgi:hypothetical protein
VSAAADEPRPDTDAAVDFLRHFRPDGPWLLGSLVEGDAKLRAITFADLGLVRAWIEREQAKAANIYYMPHLARPGVTTTPLKSEIEWLVALYADLDLPKGEAPSAEAFARLLARARALAPPPTCVIFSGGGLQLVWILVEALAGAGNIERVERANVAIAAELKSDAVQNVNRWLRLPGTVNYPNAAKRARGRVPALAYVVEADWSRRWSFDRDEVPTPAAAAEGGGRNIGDLPAKLQKLIIKPDYANYGGDRSRAVWSVCCQLVRRGWDDGAIAAVLVDSANGISQHVREQNKAQEYALKQARNAREAVGSDWDYSPRDGGIDTASRRNIDRALAEMRVALRYDEFALRMTVEEPGRAARFMDDAAVNHLRFVIDEKFDWLPQERLFQQYAEEIARERGSFHPVRDYLDGLAWDGKLRLNGWLTKYLGVADSDLTRAQGVLTLVGAVRRVRRPGCKFDEMLVLMGEKQGKGKSTALSILAVRDEWFTDSVSFTTGGKEMIEQLQGKWIVEFAELKGMRDNRVDKIKVQLSRRADRGRPAYGHFSIEAPRQCVFCGTTNSLQPLVDRTGNRRFWCVAVGDKIDLEGLARDRDQLWAEAAEAERNMRGDVRLDPALWDEAEEVAEDHTQPDAWAEVLSEAIGDRNGKIASSDVWVILGVPVERQRMQDNIVARGDAMRTLGFEHSRLRLDKGKASYVYLRGNAFERLMNRIYAYRDAVTGAVTVSYSPKSAEFEPE